MKTLTKKKIESLLRLLPDTDSKLDFLEQLRKSNGFGFEMYYDLIESSDLDKNEKTDKIHKATIERVIYLIAVDEYRHIIPYNSPNYDMLLTDLFLSVRQVVLLTDSMKDLLHQSCIRCLKENNGIANIQDWSAIYQTYEIINMSVECCREVVDVLAEIATSNYASKIIIMHYWRVLVQRMEIDVLLDHVEKYCFFLVIASDYPDFINIIDDIWHRCDDIQKKRIVGILYHIEDAQQMRNCTKQILLLSSNLSITFFETLLKIADLADSRYREMHEYGRPYPTLVNDLYEKFLKIGLSKIYDPKIRILFLHDHASSIISRGYELRGLLSNIREFICEIDINEPFSLFMLRVSNREILGDDIYNERKELVRMYFQMIDILIQCQEMGKAKNLCEAIYKLFSENIDFNQFLPRLFEEYFKIKGDKFWHINETISALICIKNYAGISQIHKTISIPDWKKYQIIADIYDSNK